MNFLETLDAVFAGAPFWLWLMVATLLGALTVWVYWRCRLDEAQAALARPPAEPIGPVETGFLAPPPAPAEDDEELSALRYRNWALETRLRQALDATRAGEPLDVAALSDGLEDLLEDGAEAIETRAIGDGAPAEAVSALKYRNWRLEMRLAELEAAAAAQPLPLAAQPLGETIQIEAGSDPARAARMEDRVRRLLTAAKLGQLSVFEAVDAEMAGEPAALIEPPAEPEPAQPPAPQGPSAEERALATRVAALEEANLILSRQKQALAEQKEALAAQSAALADEASGLRYRRWLLARRLGDAVSLSRQGRALDAEKILSDLARDREAPRYGDQAHLFAGPPAALAPAAAPALALDQPEPRREAERLRRRFAALTAELARLRATPASAPERADAEAAGLRYRLWLAQEELRRLRAEGPARPAAAPVDAAEIAALQAAKAEADAAAEAARAEAASVGALAAGLRSEAWNAQHSLTAAQMRETEIRAALAAAEAREAEIRSTLTLAQTRQGDLQAALAAAESREADAHAALTGAKAEIDRLRERQRALERAAEAAPTAEETRRREAELATLRSRLALAEAETERLKGALARARALLDAAPPAAPLAAPPPPPAPEPARPVEAVAAPAPSAETRSAILNAALAAMIATPRRGVEAAALERILSGQIAAVDSNRPRALLTEPDRGAPDRLSLIRGLSLQQEAQMARFGLYYFDQFARFGADDLAWLDDRLGASGNVVNNRWLPQAERLADLKRAGRLALDEEGRYGRYVDPSAARPPSYAPAAAEPPASPPPSATERSARTMAHETVDSLPPHPRSIIIDTPISGAETAALELLATPELLPPAEQRPHSFSTTPFAATDDLDDLQAIRGVGPNIERALRALGVGRYRQLALMTPAEAAWLDRRLGLEGRVLRDRWLPQARGLAERAEAERRLAAERAITQAPSWSLLSATDQSGFAAVPAPPQEDAEGARAEAEARRLLTAGGVTGAIADRPGNWSAGPRDQGDDLKAIRFIGPKQESLIKSFGFHSFDQIAAFSAADLAWLDKAIGAGGRAPEEGWLRQARRLAAMKREGALKLGPDGTWTLPDPAADPEAARAALNPQEQEALRLLENGFAARPENRPRNLHAQPIAKPDPLWRLQGVTPEVERALNELGVYAFRQLAGFSGAELAWIDSALGLGGALIRRRIAAQAAAMERLKNAV